MKVFASLALDSRSSRVTSPWVEMLTTLGFINGALKHSVPKSFKYGSRTTSRR